MDPDERFPIGDAELAAILMHRDAHFGGDFSVMIDYYDKEGKGTHFDPAAVHRLAEHERKQGADLAPLLLSGADAERVAASRDLYEELRDVYGYDDAEKVRLISDLILSEEEEEEEAVLAIIERGAEMIPSLIELMESSRLADPLFPGYGYAPSLAARCLGRIGDPAALYPLFEAVGGENSDLEEEAAVALLHLGKPAKEFLLEILRGEMITNDTERAAYLATLFCPDEEVTNACKELLARPETAAHPTLQNYLALATP